ncbi:MAG: single-stranded DNA-binding protein [Clostridiales bacterium]|nr:single-stranded DNA-binding protein [Clostridiales bacterium]
MNKLFIIGNLTRDPELRTTSTGLTVCSFTVAVNRRRSSQDGQPEADFFRVTAWRQLGETCAKYLSKGRKVSVVGSVSVSTYTGNDGQTRASLEVTADDIEFLTPRTEAGESVPQYSAPAAAPRASAPQGGYVQVDEEELPF